MMERVMTFTGSSAAAAFLRRFLPDPLAVRTIQTITARVCADQRSLDQPEQWVERLAPHLASGMVLVIERTMLSPGHGSTEGKTSPRATSPPPRRQSSPSDPAPDPATFSPYGVNEEAQAQILNNAAENGTPFCEECARV